MAKKRSSSNSKQPRRAGSRASSQGAGGRLRKRRLTRAAASEDQKIIYIHGIGQHPPAEQWKNSWDLALFGKPMGDQTVAAYWADVLHEPLSPTRARQLLAQPIGDDSPFDAGEILKSADLDPEDPDAVAFMHELMKSLEIPSTDMLDESGTAKRRGIGSKVLPLPAFLRQPIARQFMRWFLTDVAAYLLDEQKRESIQQRLIAQIPESGEPFLLVSHSLGTVIAFEVLLRNDLYPRPEVELFVTLGSPLGLKEVQTEVLKRQKEQSERLGLEDKADVLIVPSQVGAWYNFADRLDIVAADATLSNDFLPNGEVAIEDHRIRNTQRSMHPISPHDSAGYLAHPEVRRAVYHAAQFDWNSRFLVARDVSEQFELGQRQPVLIEILEPGYWALDESPNKMKKREANLDEELMTLEGRGQELAETLETIVEQGATDERDKKDAVDAAEITKLRKYVAAKLTPAEIEDLAQQHARLNVYRIWRSASKRALIHRSRAPLGVDAAGSSFSAVGRGITWAVLDTGCKATHPHFQEHRNIVASYDCTKPGDTPRPIASTDPAARDRNGHGSHVAGIIAGAGQADDMVYSGVAPEAKLVIYKVLNDAGEGEDAWIIKALDHIWNTNNNAFGLKIHGVNLSLGGPYDPTVFGCGYSPICTELRGLWRQGVMVCVAAGNEGQIEVATSDGLFDLNTSLSIGDPANLEECIAVGSVHADKPHLFGVSHFSSRGPTTDGRQKPDVVAPGEQIFSCNSRFEPGSSAKPYVPHSGTSMACPHISGLIAAFLSVRREFIGEPDKVKQILLDNCNDLRRHRNHQGAGIPNLVKMLVGN